MTEHRTAEAATTGTEPDQDQSHWERQARNWIAWTRKPGHDSYWYYSPQFFEELVPAPGRATLDIGCGEGRLARDLRARGHRVTAIDTSTTLLEAARAADPGGTYLDASATALPFADGAFDLAIAYNSLMDVHDMPATVAEAARVLEPGGRLCVSVTHPINDAGVFTGEDPDAAFVIEGTYLGERRRFEAELERDGLTMTFAGWAYHLEHHARALEAAGLLIEKLREPAAPEGYTDASTSGRRSRWHRIPMFLWFRALKPA